MTVPTPFDRPPGKFGKAISVYKGWPRWAQIAAPVAALALVGATAGGADEGTGEEASTTTTQQVLTLSDAVEIASSEAPDGVTDDELAGLIGATCVGLAGGGVESAARGVAEDVADIAGSVQDQAGVAEALGTGAEALCPAEVAAAPRFLNDVVRLARVQSATTLAPTTAPPTTVAPTTAPPTSPPPTTAPPTTTPPTTAPPPPPPPPPTSAGVYFDNCDAARAAGAAPLYRGDPGYRSALDRDDDGIACE